ncbi:MAG: hypothetical protein GY696_17465 [Gammaproteobacteria bacterium]|nr:hypothetical protein [Gammaproteobacteria bacterium]
MLGFMAHSVNADIEDVLRGSSSALAFVTLAQATAVMPGAQFWAICFFLMLTFLAVDSGFTMLETILTYIFDEVVMLRRHKIPTVTVAGILGRRRPPGPL